VVLEPTGSENAGDRQARLETITGIFRERITVQPGAKVRVNLLLGALVRCQLASA